MAKLVAVSIFDAKLSAFMRPYFAPSLPAAIRSFGDEVQNADGPMAKHPEDYQLYSVGAFIDDAGVFEMASPPFQVAKAVDFIKVV